MDVNVLSNKVIGAAIEVHKALVQVFWNRLTKSVCVMNFALKILFAKDRCPFL